MLFGHHVIDRTVDEHVREIAALARDSETLIFLDTNILSYLYKLHEAARREFFAWSDSAVSEGRIAVPGWAASEYLSRVTSKTLDSYTPKSKEASQAAKLLNGLFETASLFVDDASLRRIGLPGGRAAFIAGFRGAIDALTPFTRVFSQDFDSGVVHQQIEEHLATAILDSDLAALSVRATREGPGRFEHRIPPGFCDENKPENRFGDLIIWFEILEKSASSRTTFPKVLFLSRDVKSDWVYAPKMRIEVVRSDRKAVANSRPEIKLVDPRLVAEFRRVVGHSNVTIASIDTLVEGLSKMASGQFVHLATAIQINIEESVPVPPDAAVSGGSVDEPQSDAIEEVAPLGVAMASASPISNVTPNQSAVSTDLPPMVAKAEAVLPHLQYDVTALRDREYPSDLPSGINEIIRALKSLNWYTQNPAIGSIRTIRNDSFPPSSWFVLGRNIYQAACGNSQKAMEFMTGLEAQLLGFPQETAQHILAGILFEVYFDSLGNFRQYAKFRYAEKPLSVVTKEQFSEVLAFLNYHLIEYKDHLGFLPGESNQKVIVIDCVVHSPADAEQADGSAPKETVYEVRSILLDGVSILKDAAAKPDPISGFIPRENISMKKFRDQVSEELAIPKWALKLESDLPINLDGELIMPVDKVLEPRLALAID